MHYLKWEKARLPECLGKSLSVQMLSSLCACDLQKYYCLLNVKNSYAYLPDGIQYKISLKLQSNKSILFSKLFINELLPVEDGHTYEKSGLFVHYI